MLVTYGKRYQDVQRADPHRNRKTF
eukprot:COSAG02_NODE_46634_length_347_cov_0.830645_2_plen_24_part_01